MQNPQSQTVPEPKRLDWTTMVVPFLLIIILCLCFLAAPDASKAVLENLRSFLGENFGVGYLAIGLGIFLLSIYIAFSRYGTIRLGKPDEKPLYSNFAWGSMMFTSGLAADILFYSLCEWVLYANDPHLAEMGSIQDWASTYPLFHWGPIPWGFYVVLAAAFGFMLHVRGCHKQKYSEACRPILGKHHVIQPRAHKGEQRGHQHHVDHAIGVQVELLGPLKRVNHGQQEPHGNDDAVPFDGNGPDADKIGRDGDFPSQIGKLHVMLHRNYQSFRSHM